MCFCCILLPDCNLDELNFSGEMLGLPYLPTFVESRSNVSAIVSGVNYASAAGGILSETGQHLVIMSSFALISSSSVANRESTDCFHLTNLH